MSVAIGSSNLTVGYNSNTIIDGLDIQIPQNKISVIIGSNGCGKSTLLKTVSRLLTPQGGSIKVSQRDIKSYSSRSYAKTLGLLPQSPVVPEGITVRELVSRGRFPYRKFMQNLSKADYEKVDWALSIMNIQNIADRMVDELSGGQRQRVWIALCLAQQSDILLLDEPTTYLDIAYQVEILEALKKINQEYKTTIVMVLHDINLSVRYADCIFAMKGGKLVAQGSPKEIITAELMQNVYGLKSHIIYDNKTQSPVIIPL